MKAGAPARVLLVGFMGAGKTAVGEALARRLGWRFVDFDREVEAASGCSVSEIFRLRGERHFRALESEVAHRLMREESVVLGSGGGWAAQEGRLESVPAGTMTIWLRVSAAEVLRRVEAEPESRPLLRGTDPAGRVVALLEQRERFYALCEHAVDTDGRTVEDVTARTFEILANE